MARTKRNAMNIEEARKKIQTTQIVNRLTNHALGKLKKPMEGTQVTAALGLLKKSLPDVTENTNKHEFDGPLEIIITDPTKRD